MEIERKFLVRERPAPEPDERTAHLRQGYLLVCGDGEVRVRDADGVRTLTVKSAGGLSRAETEVALTAEQFHTLWPATAGRRIEKRRSRIALEGATDVVAELDVYEGALEGLDVVEVEFASEGEAKAFRPPGWFGREITDDPSYRNAALATRGSTV